MDDALDPDFFKALGDATRLQLLACLAKCGRACSVSEIAECCAVDLSVVSRHLAILAAAEVVQVEKKGRTVFYTVQFAAMRDRFRELADGFEWCGGQERPRRGEVSCDCSK